MKVSKKVPVIVYTVLGIVLLALLLSIVGRDGVGHAVVHVPGGLRDEGSAPRSGQRYTAEKDLPKSRSYEFHIPFGKVLIRPTDGTPGIRMSGDPEVSAEIRERGPDCIVEFDYARLRPQKAQTEIEIELPAVQFRELTLEFASGSLEINGIHAQKLDIEMAAGQAKAASCSFEEVEADLTAGRFDFYAGEVTRRIDADVAAGELNLYLPGDTPGFYAEYEAALGGFENKTGLPVSEDSRLGSGEISYGNRSCQIEADVSAGVVTLDLYIE